MSVLASKRGEQKLNVLISAKNLVEYILTITKNEKVFKPTYQAVTTDIIACAERIYTYLYTANEIYRNEENLETRRNYQTRESAECNVLLALMDLSQKLNHLPSKKIVHVNKMINGYTDENGNKTKGLKTLIQNWKSSDAAAVKKKT